MRYPAYSEYEDSGVTWIGQKPRHWQVRRLKEHGRLIGGTGFPIDEQGIADEALPFYKVGDLKEAADGRHMAEAPHTISLETANRLRASVIPTSAVVYAKIGAALLLNRRRLTSVSCCIDNNMTAYVPDTDQLDVLWVYHWLTKINFAEFTNPGAVPSFSEGYQGILPICVPPMKEQQKIAAFLDWKTGQIAALIARKKELLEKLKEKRLAVITQAVTKGLNPDVPMRDSGIPWLGQVPQHWDMLRIGRMITLQRGVDITKDEQEDGEVPVVSSGGIASYHTVALLKGPGVVVGRKGTAGALYYIESDYWPHDTTLYVREFWGNHPRFVYYKLLSMDLASYDTGTANPTVNRNRVYPEMVSWPPLEEQLGITNYLDQITESIDGMIAKVMEAIDRLTEYRSALITAATTGKIDVRNVKVPAPDKP